MLFFFGAHRGISTVPLGTVATVPLFCYAYTQVQQEGSLLSPQPPQRLPPLCQYVRPRVGGGENALPVKTPLLL